MRISKICIGVLAATFLAGCAAVHSTDKDVGQELSRFVDDHKTQVLDVEQGASGAVVVTTTEETVVAYLEQKKNPNIVVRRLPEAVSLGDVAAGVVSVPVAAIHRAPKSSSEIISEALMGTPVYMLEKDGWWRVQTPEGYHGWVNGLQVIAMTPEDFQAHFQKPQAMVTALEVEVSSEDGRQTVTTLTAGSLVSVVKELGKQTLIALPDGRTGRIDTQALQSLDRVYQALPEVQMREKIAQNALKLIGRSYRWAGVSTFGVDGSGLVKVAWQMAGLVGPRDADEMAVLPQRLPADTQTFEAGDLLFFGNAKSVNHVAIGLGGTRFVHAWGDVRVGDLNAASAEYDKSAKDTFMFAVRPEMNGQCIRPMTDLPLFAGKPVKPELCKLKIR
ncbi:MAG: NlpC/P60 family protein [Sutterellaceae bacterium]|nr:NlpC/P60 family protein [Sutterellaceae bacterium]